VVVLLLVVAVVLVRRVTRGVYGRESTSGGKYPNGNQQFRNEKINKIAN